MNQSHGFWDAIEGEVMENSLNFEWDEEKNKINKNKHHVSFQTASKVFYDENLVEYPDEEHSQDEDRYIAIGKVKKILFVLYTIRYEDTIRIISARKANKEEEMFYYASKNCNRLF